LDANTIGLLLRSQVRHNRLIWWVTHSQVGEVFGLFVACLGDDNMLRWLKLRIDAPADFASIPACHWRPISSSGGFLHVFACIMPAKNGDSGPVFSLT
jgi:hypothetical protein